VLDFLEAISHRQTTPTEPLHGQAARPLRAPSPASGYAPSNFLRSRSVSDQSTSRSRSASGRDALRSRSDSDASSSSSGTGESRDRRRPLSPRPLSPRPLSPRPLSPRPGSAARHLCSAAQRDSSSPQRGLVRDLSSSSLGRRHPKLPVRSGAVPGAVRGVPSLTFCRDATTGEYVADTARDDRVKAASSSALLRGALGSLPLWAYVGCRAAALHSTHGIPARFFFVSPQTNAHFCVLGLGA
jgi:hypothetical protein